MVYAALIQATDGAVTVGAYNNRPLVPIVVFETAAELKAKLDEIWQGMDGKNLVRVSRKQVVGWYGRDFATYEEDGYTVVNDSIEVEQIQMRMGN